ncbi:hypothetical protein PDESU_04699 [Pontiella desulfatans]|uniref:Uncharacterized protein n=2 Tax=Pontiella desulfatans TaxID=2750659 RepID=A0A6C2U8A6_PONDE|nr:hypothetical protein PDESU_04699 [Pontiella desulfatans]
MAALLPAICSAGETHLDIAVPSRVASDYFGPVKSVEEEYAYDMSDRKYKEFREYDRAGNLKYRKKWNSKGEQTYFATNMFNEAGCLVRQRTEDVRHGSTNDYEIVLNAPTRQIAYQCKLSGEVEILTYNSEGYQLTSTIKNKGERTLPLSKFQRAPDNTKQLYTRYDERGRIKYTMAYAWTDNGLMSGTRIAYAQKDRKDSNDYEYLRIDDQGNWTQCLLKLKTVEDGETKDFEKFTTRKIEYHDE